MKLFKKWRSKNNQYKRVSILNIEIDESNMEINKI